MKVNISLRFLRYDLPNKKYEAYEINLDKYNNTGSHWVAFYSFSVENIPK